MNRLEERAKAKSMVKVVKDLYCTTHGRRFAFQQKAIASQILENRRNNPDQKPHPLNKEEVISYLEQKYTVYSIEYQAAQFLKEQ